MARGGERRKNPIKDPVDNNMEIGPVLSEIKSAVGLLPGKPESAIGVLRKCGNMLDDCLSYQDRHHQRTAWFTIQIARSLGYPPDELIIVEAAALLHDLGKLWLDEKILMKIFPLTDQEKKGIIQHTIQGCNFLIQATKIPEILQGAFSHHEHYDGQGYPTGLAGKNIPLIARIIAVADAYEAMTTARPYRSRRTKDESIQELKNCTGSQFDPEIVEYFTDLLRKLPIYRCYKCWYCLDWVDISNDFTCPNCKTDLSNNKTMIPAVSTVEHDLLLNILHRQLTENKDIQRGVSEIILSDQEKYKPDAIYYNHTDGKKGNPMIYEVETLHTILNDNCVNKWRLFSSAAKNCNGQLFLIIQNDGFVKDQTEKLITTILKKKCFDNIKILKL